MKLQFILFFSLLPLMLICQNKGFVPKNGIITFSSLTKVTDENEFNMQLEASLPSMVDFAEKRAIPDNETEAEKSERIVLNEKVIKLNFKFINQKKVHLYKYEFNDSLINCYSTISNREFIRDELVNINRLTYTYPPDDTELPYALDTFMNAPIEEFRNENRIINGYNCFKVVFGYNKEMRDAKYSYYMQLYQQHMEMWVTESISSLFHPVFNYKQVLEKYYPLEIVMHYSVVPSLTTSYTVSELTLSKD